MKLFGKSSPLEQSEPSGRRRPQLERQDSAARGSAAIFSYYSRRSIDPANLGRRDQADLASPARPSRLPLPVWVRYRWFLSCVAAAAVAGFAYATLLSPLPKVVLLGDQTSAHFLQDSKVYRDAAAKTLSASLFNRDKLTVDTTGLRLALTRDYPEIKDVSVRLPLVSHTPVVYIEPYKPSFILTTTTSNAFVLDATGRALATTSEIPGVARLGLPTLADRSGLNVVLGKRVLPASAVAFVQTVAAALKAKNVPLASMQLPPAAYELDVYVSAAPPYFVKFNLQDDPLQQVGTYLATLQRLAADNVKPAQYIDVRVPGRAYYK